MKYTTKSGLELPPEVVEVIGDLKINDEGTWNLDWSEIKQPVLSALQKIWNSDDFAEFYKLYPKKDFDSYGNEIHKGEMVEVSDDKKDWVKRIYIAQAENIQKKYITYTGSENGIYGWKFCRKITEKQSLKSELQSQMNDLLKQAKEIEAKINEL